MKIEKIAKIHEGQDGAIWGHELFRFDHRGICKVFDLRAVALSGEKVAELSPTASFVLDRADVIAPHSNAVFFGRDFYSPEDELPLLYSNVYNNYCNSEDKHIGTCCVYRLKRTERGYASELVQLIGIGFCEDPALWRAFPDRDGVRPFGNFLMDRETGDYYAYVMREGMAGTRYFRFSAPNPHDGVLDPVYGVKRLVLTEKELLEYFDTPHHKFVQGGIIHGGLLYSTEGFDGDEVNRPAIRVIDLAAKKQIHCIDLVEMGYKEEPEFIDFYQGIPLYSDAVGNLYRMEI